jgi:hypothetical protein
MTISKAEHGTPHFPLCTDMIPHNNNLGNMSSLRDEPWSANQSLRSQPGFCFRTLAWMAY